MATAAIRHHPRAAVHEHRTPACASRPSYKADLQDAGGIPGVRRDCGNRDLPQHHLQRPAASTRPSAGSSRDTQSRAGFACRLQSQVILVDLAALAIGGVYLLRDPVRRTRRAITFLGILAAVLLAANLLPTPIERAGLESLVVVGYLVGVTRFGYYFAGLTSAEAAYMAELRASVEYVRHARARWVDADRRAPEEVPAARAGLRDICETGLRHVAELSPPSARWAEVGDVLTAYLVAMRDRASDSRRGVEGTTATDAQLDALGKALADAWNRAFGTPAQSHRHSGDPPM